MTISENRVEISAPGRTLFAAWHLYQGTKQLWATKCTLGEFSVFMGRDLDSDADPSQEGYIVEYLDGGKPNHPKFKGYVSWSPKDVFERTYRKKGDNINFGTALEALKQGEKVARRGWNGKGMFLYYVPENKYPAARNTLNTLDGLFEDNLVPYGAYIAMKTAQNNVVPWLASQTDMLAEDWMIL